MPGGNTTSSDGCATQYGVSQSVFGQDHTGVTSKDDCQNLPGPMRSACEWRFDWLQDASFPRYVPLPAGTATLLTFHSASFKRVVCPSEITAKTDCVRNDETTLAQQISGNATVAKPSSAHMTSTTFGVAVSVAGIAILLSI